MHSLYKSMTISDSGRHHSLFRQGYDGFGNQCHPYIFTFKLWDWGRLGLDGQPRPVHLAMEENIQWDRDTDWVKAQLLEQAHTVSSTPDYEIEQTGLHIREPIITFVIP
jgi:hypothetical protein